jgi:hypothetical protein
MSLLLCTFTNKKDYDFVIDDIIDCYDIIFNKIYCLENVSNSNEVFLTYNIEDHQKDLEKTISIHRKKQTNTLYTINSINEIILLNNNNVLDKNYKIDWEQYRNSILITNEGGLKVIRTKIFDIIDI